MKFEVLEINKKESIIHPFVFDTVNEANEFISDCEKIDDECGEKSFYYVLDKETGCEVW